MEEIFKGKEQGKLSKEELRVEVLRLRRRGNSWRECEDILKTPQTTLRRVCQAVPNNAPSVPESCQSVPNSVPSVPNDVPQPAPQGNKEYVTIEEIKILLKEFEENLLEKVEITINTRVNKALSYYIENKLNSSVEILVKQNLEVINRE